MNQKIEMFFLYETTYIDSTVNYKQWHNNLLKNLSRN